MNELEPDTTRDQILSSNFEKLFLSASQGFFKAVPESCMSTSEALVLGWQQNNRINKNAPGTDISREVDMKTSASESDPLQNH